MTEATFFPMDCHICRYGSPSLYRKPQWTTTVTFKKHTSAFDQNTHYCVSCPTDVLSAATFMPGYMERSLRLYLRDSKTKYLRCLCTSSIQQIFCDSVLLLCYQL